MTRFSGRVSWMLAALAIIVLVADVAVAQREGGRRGRGGRGMRGSISAVQLVAEADEVRTALNVTPEQEDKIETINDELRDARREAFGGGGGGGGDFRAAMEEMEKLNQEASAKLAEVLDEGQQKRLLGISIQVNGAAALSDSAVAKELEITDDQKTKLDEARQSNMEATREAFQDLRDQDLSQDEMREKMQQLREEGDKKLLAVLTSDQQAKLEDLKGDPVEVDMSQFRGRGFGGGRGGRGGDDGDGGRRGGRRNRDNAGEGESNN